MAHKNHPSIMDLKKNKSVSRGTEKYMDAMSDAEEVEKEYSLTPTPIEHERLKKFSHSGEKYFKILIDSISVYKDKYFKIPKNDDDDMWLEKNHIIRGILLFSFLCIYYHFI